MSKITFVMDYTIQELEIPDGLKRAIDKIGIYV